MLVKWSLQAPSNVTNDKYFDLRSKASLPPSCEAIFASTASLAANDKKSTKPFLPPFTFLSEASVITPESGGKNCGMSSEVFPSSFPPFPAPSTMSETTSLAILSTTSTKSAELSNSILLW